MSKIVVFLKPDSGSRAAVVAATRKHFDVGIKEIVDRLGAERPLVEVELFGNDHDEVAGRLAGLLDELEESKVPVILFELPEGQEFANRETHRSAVISREVLDNILQAADEELERQIRLMDLEAGS